MSFDSGFGSPYTYGDHSFEWKWIGILLLIILALCYIPRSLYILSTPETIKITIDDRNTGAEGPYQARYTTYLVNATKVDGEGAVYQTSEEYWGRLKPNHTYTVVTQGGHIVDILRNEDKK